MTERTGRTGRTEVRLEARAARQFERAPAPVQDDLRRKGRRLAADPQAGTYVAFHRRFHGALVKWRRRVGTVQNLWKLDLAEGRRAIYTVGSDGPLRVVIILEVVDHHGYDLLLGCG